VAEEVRALAQRSATAARETATRIEASVKKSHQGTEISGHVAQHFSKIQGDIVRLDSLVAQIANASSEQSQGISQLNQAVSQIDQVTQRNASAAEETAAAAEELHGQGQMLLDAVDSLRRLTGAATTSKAPRPVATATTASPGAAPAPRPVAQTHAPAGRSAPKRAHAAAASAPAGGGSFFE